MRTTRIGASVLLLGSLLIMVKSGSAAEPDKKPTGTLSRVSQFASTLRLSIRNNTLDFVKGTKHAEVKLDWDLLPLSPLLKQQLRETKETEGKREDIPANYAVAQLANNGLLSPPSPRVSGTPRLKGVKTSPDLVSLLEYFGKQPVFRDLGDDPTKAKLARQRGALILTASEARALRAANQEFDAAGWHEEFLKYWGNEAVVGPLLRQGTLTPAQHYGLLRDHQLVYTLLRSGGMSVDFNASKDEEKLKVIGLPSSIDHTVWLVRLVRFTPTPNLDFFRYAVTADIPEFDLQLPGYSGTSVLLTSQARWRAKSLKDNPSLLLGVVDPVVKLEGVEIEVDPFIKPDEEEKKDGAEEPKPGKSNGPSTLETALSLNNSELLGQVVRRNLLGGTESTSIISGSLVSKGELTQIFGTNVEFGKPDPSRPRPGFVFGVAPTDTGTLYLGPSLRADIFTLSVGYKFQEEDRTKRTPPGKGTALTGEPAGLFSVDLSRLLGGKQQSTKLLLNRANEGGDLGLSSDEIAKDLGEVGVALTIGASGAGQTPPPGLVVRRVKNGIGEDLASDKQTTILFRAVPSPGYRMFLPAGQYRYEVPDNYVLTVNGQVWDPVNDPENSGLLRVRQERFSSLQLELRPRELQVSFLTADGVVPPQSASLQRLDNQGNPTGRPLVLQSAEKPFFRSLAPGKYRFLPAPAGFKLVVTVDGQPFDVSQPLEQKLNDPPKSLKVEVRPYTGFLVTFLSTDNNPLRQLQLKRKLADINEVPVVIRQSPAEYFQPVDVAGAAPYDYYFVVPPGYSLQANGTVIKPDGAPPIRLTPGTPVKLRLVLDPLPAK